jgi:hypothetical protein
LRPLLSQIVGSKPWAQSFHSKVDGVNVTQEVSVRVALTPVRWPDRVIRPRDSLDQTGYVVKRIIAVAAAVLVAASLITASASASRQTHVICGHDSFGGRSLGTFRLTDRPRVCLIMPTYSSFASNANLTGLRWRSWGGSTAVATGISLGMHLPYSHERVRVTLSRARTMPCGGEPTLYTRVTVDYLRHPTWGPHTVAAEASCVAGPGD